MAIKRQQPDLFSKFQFGTLSRFFGSAANRRYIGAAIVTAGLGFAGNVSTATLQQPGEPADAFNTRMATLRVERDTKIQTERAQAEAATRARIATAEEDLRLKRDPVSGKIGLSLADEQIRLAELRAREDETIRLAAAAAKPAAKPATRIAAAPAAPVRAEVKAPVRVATAAPRQVETAQPRPAAVAARQDAATQSRTGAIARAKPDLAPAAPVALASLVQPQVNAAVPPTPVARVAAEKLRPSTVKVTATPQSGAFIPTAQFASLQSSNTLFARRDVVAPARPAVAARTAPAGATAAPVRTAALEQPAPRIAVTPPLNDGRDWYTYYTTQRSLSRLSERVKVVETQNRVVRVNAGTKRRPVITRVAKEERVTRHVAMTRQDAGWHRSAGIIAAAGLTKDTVLARDPATGANITAWDILAHPAVKRLPTTVAGLESFKTMLGKYGMAPVSVAELQTHVAAAKVDSMAYGQRARVGMQRLCHTESGFYPGAISVVGAQGLCQLMPDTARGLNVTDPFDPRANIDGGTRLLAANLDRSGGSLIQALGRYNAGDVAVNRNIARHGFYKLAAMNAETRGHALGSAGSLDRTMVAKGSLRKTFFKSARASVGSRFAALRQKLSLRPTAGTGYKSQYSRTERRAFAQRVAQREAGRGI